MLWKVYGNSIILHLYPLWFNIYVIPKGWKGINEKEVGIKELVVTQKISINKTIICKGISEIIILIISLNHY